MSESENPAATETGDNPKITIDEFCARKSEGMRAVELLSGFSAAMQASGVIKDSFGNFEERLEAFKNAPAA